MIIDMHTHTFPDAIAPRALEKLSHMSGTIYYTDGTENGLKQSMEQAGICYSVILPVATDVSQVVKINDGVLALSSKRAENGILSFGAMHPDFENPEKECERLALGNIRGIKLHPAYVSVDFDDPRFIRILRAAAANHLLVTIHAGIDIGIPGHDYCSTKMILSALSQVPDVTLVLAHMGGWLCWDDVAKDLKGANLFVDTSFSYGPIGKRPDLDPATVPDLMTSNAFMDLCRTLGTNRILFGTDCPWGNQKRDVDLFNSLPFSSAEKEAMLYTNAKTLLGL